jgi:hypothetical protein
VVRRSDGRPIGWLTHRGVLQAYAQRLHGSGPSSLDKERTQKGRDPGMAPP